MDAFSDLPDALVKDLLDNAIPVADNVKRRLEDLSRQKASYRFTAREIISRKADLDVPREPSVVGIDGSYQIHRLTSLDLCAVAAVAVEGTAKEQRNRHWPEPYHRIWVEAIPHNDSSTAIVRATMVSMELELGGIAPHDLVLLDGSFSSLIIYVNQGFASLNRTTPNAIEKEFIRRNNDLNLFSQIIRVLNTDRIISVPKYTSRTELIDHLGLPVSDQVDDKTIATLILQPGEFTRPLPLSHGEPYHIASCNEEQNRQLNDAMCALKVIYYRPFGWLPALRLEVTSSCANSSSRISSLLRGIESQLFSPAVIEPYPLFLADRMVKSLGSGVAVVEQAVTQHVVSEGLDVETAMLCLQNYRTEGGRGGTS